jgi:hypothetical protein
MTFGNINIEIIAVKLILVKEIPVIFYVNLILPKYTK